MAKIGDELYLESSENGLTFRTINSAESAYCTITFGQAFFAYFDSQHAQSNTGGLKCKISMKSALTVFKSPANMDKQVDICEIKSDPEESKLIFRLRCKHGIVKTHFVSILEGKKMEASYSIRNSPNRFSAHHKILADAIGNFQISEDQITVEVNPQALCLRNFTSSNADLTKITRTQLSLKPVEFDSYSITVDTSVTFSLKEFRALLIFAEAVNLPIALVFETSGKPVVFIVASDSTFEANFVMATERPDCGTQSSVTQLTNSCKRKYGDISRSRVDIDDADLFNFTKDHSDEEADNINERCSPIVFSQTTTKIRKVFRRCFDATFHPSDGDRTSIVLAEDSDCE